MLDCSWPPSKKPSKYIIVIIIYKSDFLFIYISANYYKGFVLKVS
jgi:hypothetical protein